MIAALNWLAGGGSGGEEGGPASDSGAAGEGIASPTPTQLSLLNAIREACRGAWRRGVFKNEPAPAPEDFGYFMKEKKYQDLRVEDLALPADGVAATVDIVSLLPENLRVYFEREDSGIVIGSTAAEREAAIKGAQHARYAWGVKDEGDYGAVVRRLHEIGMVALGLTPPRVYNGMFAVPKPSETNPDRQRLITDARPQNSTQAMPWDVRLPSPETFSALIIPQGGRLAVAKLDVDSMFHRFRVPDWLAEFQGLPPIEARYLIGAQEAPGGGKPLPIWSANGLANLAARKSIRRAVGGAEAIYGITNRYAANSTLGGAAFWPRGITNRDAALLSGQKPGANRGAALSDWAGLLADLEAAGLDPGAVGGLIVYPRVRSMLMGWTGSVHCAQVAFEQVVSRATGEPVSRFLVGRRPQWLRGEETAQCVYIDDHISLGLSAARVNAVWTNVREGLPRAGLLESKGKSTPATEKPSEWEAVSVLGTEIEGGRRFGPDRHKLRRLRCRTLRMLGAPYVSGHSLRALLGDWAWVSLCNRPFFSIFEHAYRYVHFFGPKAGRLWASVRQELKAAVAISPLLWSRLDAQLCTRVYATDASEFGGGTAYTTASSVETVYQLVREAEGHVGDREGSTAVRGFVEKHEWKWATSHAWHHEEHINALEYGELLIALRRHLRSASNWGQRVVVLVDSTVVTYGASKGRSGAHRLNTLGRRLAALTLPTGTRVLPVWVPTESNPADAPSRAPRLPRLRYTRSLRTR